MASTIMLQDTTEFEWQMQLRYYYESEDVVVRQVNARCVPFLNRTLKC